MGIFGAPALLSQFKAFTDPDWNVLDLLEHIEARMHNYVRTEMGAMPPGLKSERISANELKVDIKSHRRMGGEDWSLGNGIAQYAWGDSSESFGT